MPLNPSENALFLVLCYVNTWSLQWWFPYKKNKNKCETALNPHMSTSRALLVLIDERIVVLLRLIVFFEE